MLFLKLQSVLEGRLISSQFTADQEWWRFHNVQNPHLDTVRSSLFDHRLDGGLREFGIINRKENSHDWLSLSPGRRCFRLFAGLTDGSDFGHHDFEHVVLYFRRGAGWIDI